MCGTDGDTLLPRATATSLLSHMLTKTMAHFGFHGSMDCLCSSGAARATYEVKCTDRFEAHNDYSSVVSD